MSPWLLLVHQLPPNPPYLRAKISRRLGLVGALALKNSVYLLPQSAGCREDFEWIAREAVEGSGASWIGSVDWLSGWDDEAIVAAFRSQSGAEYRALRELFRAEVAALPRALAARRAPLAALVANLQKTLAAAVRRDFFGAPERADVELLLRSLAERSERAVSKRERARRTQAGTLRGKTWVTRSGVFVDRIATAWLVRRFVDPEAKFRFVEGSRAPRRDGEIRFDLVEAEVTHEGDRCTFEVLLARLGSDDSALTRLAGIVHDIDLKDEKFGHPETLGIERSLEGLVALAPSDEVRLESGFALFDALYRSFTPIAPAARQRPRRSS